MKNTSQIPNSMQFTTFAIATAAIFSFSGCKKMANSSNAAPYCFEANTANTTIQTNQIFKKRNCQGGGVTWSPILTAFIESKGTLEDYVYTDTNGLLGSAYIFNGFAKVAIDDEGDAALFCSNDSMLTNEIKVMYFKANADSSFLHTHMSKASALLMECLEEDGSLPKLPRQYNIEGEEILIPDSLYLKQKPKPNE